jgi:hypothetical protein
VEVSGEHMVVETSAEKTLLDIALQGRQANAKPRSLPCIIPSGFMKQICKQSLRT